MGSARDLLPVTVRELRSPEAFLEVVALERAIWGMPDIEVVPKDLLVALVHEGGLVAGAFLGERMVGFVLGFPTADPGVQHSHMMGVLPDCRDRGIGFALKRFQRAWCLARGIGRVVWTFDPLRARNANFNLRKLGARSRTYLPDFYGPMGGINRGVPSDRLLVEWVLDAPEVVARLEGRRAEPDAAGLPFANRVEGEVPLEARLDVEAPRLLVRIPRDFGAILSRDPALAARWRQHIREVLSHYLARGFVVADFVGREGPAYVLVREDDAAG